MRCEWTAEDLSAYVDGEVHGERAERLRLHLSACTHCRRQAEAFRQMGTLVRAAPEVSPPADLRARVVALDAGAPVPAATCEQARAWMSQRADGELPHWQVPVLEQHLAGCEACGREADAFTGMIGLVQALPEVNPPLRIRAAVRNAMARRAQARRVWRMGWGGVGFALAGSLAVLLMTLHPGRQFQPANVAQVGPPEPAVAQPVVPPSAGTEATSPAAVAQPVATPARPAPRVGGVQRLARAVVGALAHSPSPAPKDAPVEASTTASTAGESVARVVRSAAAEVAYFADPREAMKAASQRQHVVASEAALATPPEEPPPAVVETSLSTKGETPKEYDPAAALAEAKQTLKERPFKSEVIRVERKQPVVHAEY